MRLGMIDVAKQTTRRERGESKREAAGLDGEDKSIEKGDEIGDPDRHRWTPGIAAERRSEKASFVKEDLRSLNGFRQETAQKETKRKPRTNFWISFEVT